MTIASATVGLYPMGASGDPQAGSATTMPSVSMHFDTPPERTWEALSEPRAYGFWVTGAHGVHESDPNWPEQGAAFRHTQGIRPLLISDTTTVLRSDPPRRIELEARVRPLLIARVIVTIEPEGDGSHVVMEELATGGLLAPLMRLPGADALIRARNRESLRRLHKLAGS
jgi:uncharacterized protein YndB with AHSA1/START domain